jgi:uncharacterized membrane protein
MQTAGTDHKTKFLLIACALLYAAGICALSLTRLYTYKASLMDAGMLDQTMWNFLHHQGPTYTTSPPYTPQNWFGYHFSPIAMVMLPFYAVWPHWEVFEVTQSLCFAFTGVILFFALKQAGAKESEAWAGAFLYWLNPFVVAAGIWDFHEIAFANLFMAWGVWAVFARRFDWLLVACALLLLTKEHYGVSVAGFGFLWGWRHHEWKRAALVMLGGIAALALIFGYIVPGLHGGRHFMLEHTHDAMDRYSWLTEPWSKKLPFAWELLCDSGFNYIFLLLLAGLFFPLAAPFYLAPAASDIIANLLCSTDFQRNLGSYHSATIIVVMIAAGYQGKQFCSHKLRHHPYAIAALATCSAIAVFGLTTLPVSGWELQSLRLHADRAALSAVDQVLPDGAISVQNNVGMFFSRRREIYPFPHGMEKTSAIVLYMNNPFTTAYMRSTRIAFGETPETYQADVDSLLKDTSWHIAYWEAPWLVMERGAAAKDESKAHADIRQSLDSMTRP